MEGGHNTLHQSSLDLLAPTQRPKEKGENIWETRGQRQGRTPELTSSVSHQLRAGAVPYLADKQQGPRPQEHPTRSTAPGSSTKAQAAPEWGCGTV